MESYNKAEAERKSSKILNINKNAILALNSSSSTYIDRGIVEALSYFDETGSVPTVVAFLNKIEAEDAEAERKKVSKRIKSLSNKHRKPLLCKNCNLTGEYPTKACFLRT